jgi:hypothetical protein
VSIRPGDGKFAFTFVGGDAGGFFGQGLPHGTKNGAAE